MRVFGSNDVSCILVLKDKAVCLFPFFELLSSHSQFFSVYVSILFRLTSLVVGLLLSFCLYFSVPAYVCLFLSLLNLLLLYVSHLSLHISLCTACIICLTVSLPFLSLWLSASCFASRSLFISLPYFFVSPFWFFFFFVSCFCVFFLSAGYFCILSWFLLCPSFRLWHLCSLCFYCLAQLQKVMGAKCLCSQWQDGPYKSTELIDVMYDTLRDCFDKEVASYCKDTAFDCLCVRVRV